MQSQPGDGTDRGVVSSYCSRVQQQLGVLLIVTSEGTPSNPKTKKGTEWLTDWLPAVLNPMHMAKWSRPDTCDGSIYLSVVYIYAVPVAGAVQLSAAEIWNGMDR